MKQYATWRAGMQARIDALANADARQYINGWADDVRARIEDGELGVCTTALAASVRRDIEAWERGLFSHVGPHGERHYATA
jgi:hypothetical protein